MEAPRSTVCNSMYLSSALKFPWRWASQLLKIKYRTFGHACYAWILNTLILHWWFLISEFFVHHISCSHLFGFNWNEAYWWVDAHPYNYVCVSQCAYIRLLDTSVKYVVFHLINHVYLLLINDASGNYVFQSIHSTVLLNWCDRFLVWMNCPWIICDGVLFGFSSGNFFARAIELLVPDFISLYI